VEIEVAIHLHRLGYAGSNEILLVFAAAAEAEGRLWRINGAYEAAVAA
jgi:hypothetical protein